MNKVINTFILPVVELKGDCLQVKRKDLNKLIHDLYSLGYNDALNSNGTKVEIKNDTRFIDGATKLEDMFKDYFGVGLEYLFGQKGDKENECK